MEVSDKMRRFLSSMKITNVDDFDMDFLMISKSKVENNRYIYSIEKKSPWKYDILLEFLDGLKNIVSYSYSFNFVYTIKPTDEEILSLIKSLLKEDSIFIKKSYFENGNIYLITDEEYLPKINFSLDDVKAIFNLISYNYVIICESENQKNVNDDLSDIYDEESKIDLSDIDRQTQENIVYKKEADAQALRNKTLFKKGGYNQTKICFINENSGAVDISGKITECEVKLTRKAKKIGKIVICDDTDAINVSLIANEKSIKAEDLDKFAIGMNINILGRVDIDSYSKEKNVYVMCHSFNFLEPDKMRDDLATKKRVELHLHTNYSEMDGINEIKDYCALAAHFGHKAIAVTDHAVVQAFPEAQEAAKKNGLKMIYGCEFYMINDYLEGALNPTDEEIKDIPIVVFDLESTGLNVRYDRITEIGAVKFIGNTQVDSYEELVNPGVEINKFIQEKTHITNEMVKDKPLVKDVLPSFLKFIEGCIIISHNIEFDYNMLSEEMRNNGFGELKMRAIDTLQLSRFLFPEAKSHSLGALCKRCEVDYISDDQNEDDEEKISTTETANNHQAHRADYDAGVLGSCWVILKDKLDVYFKHSVTLNDLAKLPYPKEYFKHINKLGNYHVTVYCKNEKGLRPLYELVSESHCNYVGIKPFLPKSLIEQKRENLLVGSACANGEIVNYALRRTEKDVANAMDFYDFIEIQPLENYRYLVDSGEVNSFEDLKKNIADIIRIATYKHKLIVATGDVHYLNPENKISRDIYIESTGIGNTFHPLAHYKKAFKKNKFTGEMEQVAPYYDNPDQHFRTTDEMLEAFEWVGKEKAEEYVIINSNIIADMCEPFLPVPPGLATPVIDNCDKLLLDLCYNRAYSLYGKPLPDLVEKRLKRELDGIIDAGYYVTYYIAHKLVLLANEAGHLVGSRGSVGSSFAATMAGITEVNPLPPHYRCPKCCHFELYDGKDIFSGIDLTEKKCPNCGEFMVHDGQDIPFETFLGFHAEKVPDIDLNFPSDYQEDAFLLTKPLLGEDKVFRAGTISTTQDKTAYGYVKNYFDSFNKKARNAYIASLSKGLVGVKRTTGQHAGGIVVVPRDHDVNDFTPIQYPANDTSNPWKTTHFAFEAIHDKLLKLDMLGHIDPQAIKFLTDLTGVDYKKIQLYDKKILSLFTSDEELHLMHKYMKNDIGALGLPEFGTSNTMQVLRETKPKSFNDLLILSGITHGNGIWANNQQDLIRDGVIVLKDAIGCRDDIMTYLIHQGVPSEDAFTIMETVRKKGKYLNEAQKELMRKCNIPEFYIESCDKIEYMFPRGHACAYVTMAIRIAYFKLYYPLEFYAQWFSLRADDFDVKAMIGGIDKIHERMIEIEQMKKSIPGGKLPKKEGDIYECLKVALEMTERGYKFLNIDIYKSMPNDYVVDHEQNGLYPAFKSISGLGLAAGEGIVRAREEKPFISQQDLLKRSGITQTNLKDLKALGSLDDLKETDSEASKMSLFDFNFGE